MADIEPVQPESHQARDRVAACQEAPPWAARLAWTRTTRMFAVEDEQVARDQLDKTMTVKINPTTAIES